MEECSQEQVEAIRHLALGFPSSFGFRNSSFLVNVIRRDARLGGKFVFFAGRRTEHDLDQISAMATWRRSDFSRRAAAARLDLQVAAGPLAFAEIALLGVGGPEANAFRRLIDFDGDFRRVLVLFFE